MRPAQNYPPNFLRQKQVDLPGAGPEFHPGVVIAVVVMGGPQGESALTHQ